MGLVTIPGRINTKLIIMSGEKKDLKIRAEETGAVAQGRKIRVLKRPLHFSFLLLKIDAGTRARKSMMGTWMTSYMNTLVTDFGKAGSWKSRR
jgi:hypothetical protein